jgi:hypothetical protein
MPKRVTKYDFINNAKTKHVDNIMYNQLKNCEELKNNLELK